MHPTQFIVLALAAGAVAVPQGITSTTMPPWFVYCHSAPPKFPLKLTMYSVATCMEEWVPTTTCSKINLSYLLAGNADNNSRRLVLPLQLARFFG
jgi:hypothetical protein